MRRHFESKSPSRKCNASRRQRQAALRLESLESRQLLAYSAVVLDAAPLVYYQFEEASVADGQTAADTASVAAGNNAATYTGTLAVGSPPAEIGGQALTFSGTDDVVVSNAPVSIAGTAGEYSVELWFNANSLALQDMFVASTGTGHAILLELGANGNIRFLHRVPAGASGGQSAFAPPAAYTAGRWHHLVAVNDGSQMRLYLDGAQTATAAPTGMLNFATDLSLGRLLPGNNQRSFNGRLDEVAVYDRALTPAEITAHYKAGDGVNEAPTANDDPTTSPDPNYTANEDSALNVNAANGLLANDTDPDANALNVADFDSTSTGGAAVSVNPDGSFTYDPSAVAAYQALDDGETLTDTFTYTINDNTPATVVGYWRMEQDTNAAAGFSVPNEVAGGNPLVGAAGSVEILTGSGIPSRVPQTGQQNLSGINGNPNINGTIAQYAGLNPSSISVEMYVRTNEGDARLLNAGYAAGVSGYRIHQPNNVLVEYNVSNGAGGATAVSIPTTINLDATWRHVAWTYDQATGIGTVYLNGAPVATNDGPDGRALVLNTGAAIQIGEGFDGGGPFSTNNDAMIDEVRISSVALPATRLLSALASDTATVSMQVTGVNDAPAISNLAVAPNPVNEASVVNLTADIADVDTENVTVTINWGDGTADSVTTVTGGNGPISLMHIYDDDNNGGSQNYTITVTASDDDANPATATGTDVETASITVQNVPPAASISAPAEVVPGSDVMIAVSADDPSNADDAGTFIYEIDFDYNGVSESIDATMTGPMSGVTFTTQYGSLGTHTVAVFATDKDGGRSMIQTFDIEVVPVAQVGDDIFAGGTDLVSDRIVFYPTNAGVQVRYNNTTYPLSGGSFTLTPGSTRLIAFGRGGADNIVVSGRIDAPAEFDGGDSNDYLAGGTQNDTLWGGAGNDVILAGEGDNYLDGGIDNDRLEGRSGIDIVFGGDGSDRLNGGAGDDILDGGGGNDVIFGDLGNDLLVGGTGLDTIQGSGGNDIILGGDDIDQVFGGVGNDLLIGGNGADRVRGDAGDDDVIGGTSALDDNIEAALDAMMASLGTLDLAAADPAVSMAVNNWRTTGTDRSGFGALADDSTIDDLTGGTGTDEFHTTGDNIRDLRTSESDSMIP